MRRLSRQWVHHNVSHFTRRADWLWRRATASSRVLPNFIIIGTMKGGTTSLYDYVCQHPRILSAYRKEVHFFDMHYTKGPNWYRANFPTSREIAAAGENAQTGESTPYYLFHPAGPSRLFKLLPQAKLIVVLRNPVDRAISHYFHSVRTGMERRPIEQAFAEEQSLIAAETNRLLVDGYESDQHRMWSYLARGKYAEQLEAFLQVYPRSQLLVLRSEELFTNPQATSNRTTDFLGLESVRLHQAQVLNKGTYGEPGDSFPAEFRDRLAEYFVPHNEQLSKLLGEEFAW